MQNENDTDELRSALAQLQFLKGSLRQVFGWLVFCLLTGLLVWAFAMSYAASEKTRIETLALDGAVSRSVSYAEQLTRTVEQLDQTTLRLAYYWKYSGGRLRLQDQAGQGLYPDVAGYSVAIFSRNGKLRTSLHGQQDVGDISDQPYFQAHKAQHVTGLQVTRLEEGMPGAPAVVFSRALADKAGRFDGLVCLTVPSAFLASFYEAAAEGENNALALLTTTGEAIVTKMGRNLGALQALVKGAAVFPAPHGKRVLPGTRFNDGLSRIVAWKTLEKYPLVSVVALAEKDVYLPYENIRRNIMGMATAASLLLLLAGTLGSVVLGRLAWRKHQATVIADTYRLAIEGAREGFFMARALYGQDRSVTDFVVENCNEQGARMIGFSRDELIEVRFSQIYPGRIFERVKATFSKAMEQGFHEDEFVQAGQDGVRTWIHRRLVRSGDGIAITLRDISEAKAHESALESLGNTDALTGLRNRYWLSQYLPRALEKAQRARSTLAVLYLDLDDFKDVNNTMGHDAGDHVLRQAGQRIASVLRPGDHVVRLGGDEFTVLLTRAEQREDVVGIAARILDALSAPFQVRDGQQPRVCASIGISMYPEDGQTTEALLQHADTAMYAAKNNGKGRHAFYAPALTEEIVCRIRNETALRHAIEVNEFVLHYQPRANAVTGELLSMEALVRWMHPERGMVPPLEFIGLAEDTGLIVELGKLVIDQACMQIAAWQTQGLPVVPLSVNVSPVQFAHCDLQAIIAESLKRHRVDPALLEVEVTESCMMQDSEKVAQEVAAIKSLGVRISVDDFGTGYSSLSQLQRLDLDVLKVDRAFTQALNDGRQGVAFFMTIVSMAHILDMHVVAEGVETLEQLIMLQNLGCNEVQGYFISSPVPAALATAFLGRPSLFPDAVPARQAA